MSDSSETCAHGKQAPRVRLADVPVSQAGTGPHKCAVCAYDAGATTPRHEPGPFKVEDVVISIHAQVELLKRCRATFPHILPTMVGQTEFQTAPYYLAQGHSIWFRFEPALDAATAQVIHETGHWINQNFVVRLCAVLEAHHIIGKEIENKPDLDGFIEVSLTRRLRNIFAHGSGRCDPAKADHLKLKNKIVERFALNAADCPEGWFPLPIDKVLAKLATGCEKYVRMVGNAI